MRSYRIEIDRSLCSGFGSCVQLAPEAFELGPDGIAVGRLAADGADAHVLEAVESCPMGAINIVADEREAA